MVVAACPGSAVFNSKAKQDMQNAKRPGLCHSTPVADMLNILSTCKTSAQVPQHL